MGQSPSTSHPSAPQLEQLPELAAKTQKPAAAKTSRRIAAPALPIRHHDDRTRTPSLNHADSFSSSQTSLDAGPPSPALSQSSTLSSSGSSTYSSTSSTFVPVLSELSSFNRGPLKTSKPTIGENRWGSGNLAVVEDSFQRSERRVKCDSLSPDHWSSWDYARGQAGDDTAF